VINTSAITAITKSSMKPQSGANANHLIRSKWRKEWRTKENKGKLGYNHDASTGAAAVGTSRDKAKLNSEEIKPTALVVIELRLSEGVSQSVK